MADTPSRGGVAGTYLQSLTFGSPMFGAATGNGAAWFGPSIPMAPTAPPEVASRQYDYPVGYNLNTQPRTYEPITFRTLRDLADGYDLLRTVIETRKDQLSRMSWSIKGRATDAKDKGDPRVQALTAFFQRPDGVNGWHDWLRPLLEDLFVIDAPTLFLRRDRGGRPFQLLQLDGATIKPIIDDWGRTPQPFISGSSMVYPAAYQQVLKGFPAVDYSTRNLLYRPRNRRVFKPYGYSPVEQIITTVNIALRRQLFTLSYFTEGSIPDSIIQVPKEWTPDQINTFQISWDANFIGDLAMRRRAKFVPGGVGTGVHETKTPDLKGDFDEWLAKLICFAFSISPQALTRQMNRASADTQKELAEEEGLEPILLWLKAWMDDIIAQQFEMPDLEFTWDNDDEVDQAQQLTVLTGYVSKAILTINECRDELGMDPLPDPEASQAMIITASGAVPLNSFAQAQQQQQNQMQANAEAAARLQSNPQAAGSAQTGRPNENQHADEPADVEKFNQNHDEHGRFASSDEAAGASDAADWGVAKSAAMSIAKGVALVAAGSLAVALAPETFAVAGTAAAVEAGVEAGTLGWVTRQVEGAATGMFIEAGFKSAKVLLRHAGYDTTAIEQKVKVLTDIMKASGGGDINAKLRDALRDIADHARDALVADITSRHAGSSALKTAIKAINAACEEYKDRLIVLGKFKKFNPSERRERQREPLPFDRPAIGRAQTAIGKKLSLSFANLAKQVAALVQSKVAKVAKVGAPEDPDDVEERARREADEIVDAFDLSELQDLASDLGEDLSDVVNDVVGRALVQVGVDDVADLVDQVNKRAVQMARDRAAELVGMKYDASGNLVPSDDADMAITDTTRDMLRQTIADGLADNIGSDAIADSIADSYAFSDDRAEMIADTEIRRANSMAAVASYRSARDDAGVNVQKEWLAAPDCCDVCSDNAAAGAIDLDDEFPSGDDTPPGHPKCRCSLNPVVGNTEKSFGLRYVRKNSSDQPRDSHGRWTDDGGVTEAEKREALKRYTGADFQAINRELRGIRPASGNHDKTVRALDSFLDGSARSGKRTLYRGVGGLAAQTWANQLSKGSVISDPGFMSATTDMGVAKFERSFSSQSRAGILMEISVPDGAKAVDISSLSDNPSEKETLLARKSSLKVTGWSEKTRVLKVSML